MSDQSSRMRHLLDDAVLGDRRALDRLLSHYRNRLKRMVAVRMNDEIRARVDPSDIVQETLVEAAGRLEKYATAPDAPFYLWLRRIAYQRVIDTSRRHVATESRSVRKEQPSIRHLPDQSAVHLVNRLVSSESSPSRNMGRKEMQQQVRSALVELPKEEQEILILRYLEQLRPGEISQLLGLPQRTVRGRHRRALNRMLKLLCPPETDVTS